MENPEINSERYCYCGDMATLGVGRVRATKKNPEGVERWLCFECFDKKFKLESDVENGEAES